MISTAAVLLTGCVVLGDKLDQFRWTFMTLPLYVFDNIAGYKNPPEPPVMDEKITLAISVSGGGSRSAVFSSGVLEQLAYIPDPRHPGRTILDGVDVISGVSGGSLSATYYSLYKPADFSNQDVNVEFFQRYKSNMTTDFHMRGVAHYLSHPWEAVGKYYTRYRFVQTLGETFDQHIFKGSTFDQLHEREMSGLPEWFRDLPYRRLRATVGDGPPPAAGSPGSLVERVVLRSRGVWTQAPRIRLRSPPRRTTAISRSSPSGFEVEQRLLDSNRAAATMVQLKGEAARTEVALASRCRPTPNARAGAYFSLKARIRSLNAPLSRA